MLYIDTGSFDDFDRVARYLFERNVPIVKRNKAAMVLAADVSQDFVTQMTKEIKFDEGVSAGETPLDPRDFD